MSNFPVTSIEELKELIKTGVPENQYLEFKSSKILSEDQAKEKILKEIIAFANSDGGQIGEEAPLESNSISFPLQP